jgi:hypothetical protein
MMTATTIKQTEEIPASYPATPSGLSAAAAALDADMIWQRIEAYIAHRFTEREVTWIVEGPGDWQPPLSPAAIDTVEVWQADAWEAVTLSPSALGGYVLPGCGPYRFTGTLAGGSPGPAVPAVVERAFVLLAEYMAAKKGQAGATSERVTAGSVTVEKSRSASWAAEAMQNSGAGDLLRNYRRAG